MEERSGKFRKITSPSIAIIVLCVWNRRNAFTGFTSANRHNEFGVGDRIRIIVDYAF